MKIRVGAAIALTAFALGCAHHESAEDSGEGPLWGTGGGAANSNAAYQACLFDWSVLRGGGRERANCQGDCRYVLELMPTAFSDAAACGLIYARLAILNTDGTLRVIKAELPGDAWSRFAEAAHELKAAQVAWVPSCADCAGDRAWVIRDAFETPREEFHYRLGAVPPALAVTDRVVQTLIDALSACAQSGAHSPLLAKCEVDRTACWFELEDPATGAGALCSVHPEGNPSCADALSCWCGSAVLPGSFDPSCNMRWLDPVTPMSLGQLCGPDQAAAGRTFADALRAFAAGLDRTIYLANECTSISAR
jgi:hypothetical protein